MQALMRPGGALHIRIDGPDGAPALLMLNSLGTDLRLWDGLMPHLSGFRVIRYDKQGHGLSDLWDGSTIAAHAADAVAVIEAAGGPVTLVGCSIGGLIAQVVAAERPNLVRALVLSNSAAKLGNADSWNQRIAAVQAGGTEAIADAVMERWFAAPFRASPQLALWRNMLARTGAPGYIAACRALAASDQTGATRALRLPTLVIAGSQDGAAPPDLVRATADLIAGAEFHLIDGAGHLPCVETPAAMAAILIPFLERHA
ncbi:3-oxoadipate enol-lactonase [Paracoccus tibetensis]|uniref:3-oxoadipate enol-lactonase n=1 Tax=Paracoccus tibetensis TaxID=336292 RepID=A0A1G5D0Z7_9RHOB|nr:3-oxoadipate enol-lactonase [Paracoccus tibetensis]SCY08393.1 3-oxoadipate enol-lactonase [Paracoccus tibetensis]